MCILNNPKRGIQGALLTLHMSIVSYRTIAKSVATTIAAVSMFEIKLHYAPHFPEDKWMIEPTKTIGFRKELPGIIAAWVGSLAMIDMLLGPV